MSNFSIAYKYATKNAKLRPLVSDGFFAPFKESTRRKLRKKLIDNGFCVFPINTDDGAVIVHHTAKNLELLTDGIHVMGTWINNGNVVILGSTNFADAMPLMVKYASLADCAAA